MTCKPYVYQGLSNCVGLLQRAVAVIVTDKGTTSSKAEWTALAANKTIVAGVAGTKGILIDLKRGMTRTSDDPEITTSALNMKDKTQNSLPSAQGFGVMSADDYKTLLEMEGNQFDIRVILNNGIILGTNNSDGTVKGFRGRLSFRYDLPSDDPQQSYPIDFFFDSWNEFKNYHVAKALFTPLELKSELPVGIDLSLITAYTAGVVVINSVKRSSGAIFNGFVAAANWIITDTNVVDPSVTLAAVVNGVNTVTIKKTGGTVNLAAGEYVTLQGVTDDGTYITDASVTFEVLA